MCTNPRARGAQLRRSQPAFIIVMVMKLVSMTDYNGLTMYCKDGFTNTRCEFINNELINYWIRNSFNYITFINRLTIADNRKFYVLIDDYLA